MTDPQAAPPQVIHVATVITTTLGTVDAEGNLVETVPLQRVEVRRLTPEAWAEAWEILQGLVAQAKSQPSAPGASPGSAGHQ